MYRLIQVDQSEDWNRLISTLPNAHIFQTEEWAEIKANIGWRPIFYTWKDDDGKLQGAALVLYREATISNFRSPLKILYIPKGPCLDWSNDSLRRQVLVDLGNIAQQQGALFIKIDPDVTLGFGYPGYPGESQDLIGKQVEQELQANKWRYSDEQIQFRNTVLLDLSVSEDILLSNMKQKTRYNIRLAERKGVVIRQATTRDLSAFYQMYAETSIRDGFVIRSEKYYLSVWSLFMQKGMAEAFVAEVEGEAVAGLFLFAFCGRAWYLYGMSRTLHREKMPNYLLQWAAIRRAKEKGCQVYDLWGAPDRFEDTDPLWGVYKFKEGLGGKVVRTIGAWDLPIHPQLYWLYNQALPRVLSLLRWRGIKQTRQVYGA